MSRAEDLASFARAIYRPEPRRCEREAWVRTASYFRDMADRAWVAGLDRSQMEKRHPVETARFDAYRNAMEVVENTERAMLCPCEACR